MTMIFFSFLFFWLFLQTYFCLQITPFLFCILPQVSFNFVEPVSECADHHHPCLSLLLLPYVDYENNLLLL